MQQMTPYQNEVMSNAYANQGVPINPYNDTALLAQMQQRNDQLMSAENSAQLAMSQSGITGSPQQQQGNLSSPGPQQQGGMTTPADYQYMVTPSAQAGGNGYLSRLNGPGPISGSTAPYAQVAQAPFSGQVPRQPPINIPYQSGMQQAYNASPTSQTLDQGGPMRPMIDPIQAGSYRASVERGQALLNQSRQLIGDAAPRTYLNPQSDKVETVSGSPVPQYFNGNPTSGPSPTSGAPANGAPPQALQQGQPWMPDQGTMNQIGQLHQSLNSEQQKQLEAIMDRVHGQIQPLITGGVDNKSREGLLGSDLQAGSGGIF